MTIEWHVEPAEALRIILASVVELTKLRQDECKHLAIENFTPELFRKMMLAYYSDAGATITIDQHAKIDEGFVKRMEQGVWVSPVANGVVFP